MAKRATDIASLDGNGLVAYYLQAGWLYENRFASFLDDAQWDALCTRLIAEWDEIPDSEHKRVIQRDALDTGTASYLTDETTPLIAQYSASKKLFEATGEVVEPRPARSSSEPDDDGLDIEF